MRPLTSVDSPRELPRWRGDERRQHTVESDQKVVQKDVALKGLGGAAPLRSVQG